MQKLMGLPLNEVNSIRVDGVWIGVKNDLAIGTDEVVSWTGWPTASANVVRYAFPLSEIKGVCCAT